MSFKIQTAEQAQTKVASGDFEPGFSTIDAAFKGFLSKSQMVCSIINGDLKAKENSKDSQSIFAIIQGDKTKNSTSSNELFTSLSMLALRVYSNYLSQRFENKVSQIERQRLQTRTINVFESFKNIAEEYYLRKTVL